MTSRVMAPDECATSRALRLSEILDRILQCLWNTGPDKTACPNLLYAHTTHADTNPKSPLKSAVTVNQFWFWHSARIIWRSANADWLLEVEDASRRRQYAQLIRHLEIEWNLNEDSFEHLDSLDMPNITSLCFAPGQWTLDGALQGLTITKSLLTPHLTSLILYGKSVFVSSIWGHIMENCKLLQTLQVIELDFTVEARRAAPEHGHGGGLSTISHQFMLMQELFDKPKSTVLDYLSSPSSHNLESLTVAYDAWMVLTIDDIRLLSHRPRLRSLNLQSTLSDPYDMHRVIKECLQTDFCRLEALAIPSVADDQCSATWIHIVPFLSEFRFASGHPGGFFSSAEHISKFSHLTTLEIRATKLGPSDDEESNLRTLCKSCPKLLHLNIELHPRAHPRPWQNSTFREAFARLSLLQTLTVHVDDTSRSLAADRQGGVQNLGDIGLGCPSLRAITMVIPGVILTGQKSYAASARCLPELVFPRLEELSITLLDFDSWSHPFLDRAEIDFLARNAPNLSKVSRVGYPMDGESILAEHNGSKLQWYRKEMRPIKFRERPNENHWSPYITQGDWYRRIRYDSNGPYEESLNGDLFPDTEGS